MFLSLHADEGPGGRTGWRGALPARGFPHMATCFSSRYLSCGLAAVRLLFRRVFDIFALFVLLFASLYFLRWVFCLCADADACSLVLTTQV